MATSSTSNAIVDIETIKDRLFAIIEPLTSSITEEELSVRMNDVDKGSRLTALNSLIKENKIKATLDKNKRPRYEKNVIEKTPEEAVFEVISESGKNGIWKGKKSIRALKSISNRKLYVLFNLEPDETITGGACFESGFIREDIVKNLKSTCFQYVYDRYQESYNQMITNLHSVDNESTHLDKIYVTAQDVFNELAQRNIFTEIKLGDIEHILNILSYECKLNKMSVGVNKLAYRYNPYNRDKTDMFYSPCMLCHLYKDCKPESVHISPENCKYLSVEKF
ncbi:DNA-directed RNA polymerase III subunit RPC6 [Blomia tropicalis]|nr:DNA-directed RNA polymerase III subunit RPC6 [Blomia tropicalis]